MCKRCPICVDLDGTLIKGNVSRIMIWRYLCENPLNIFKMIWWIRKGRCYFKARLASSVCFDPAILSYNTKLLDYLRSKKQEGAHIYLATGCTAGFAKKIADFLQIFDGVLASDEHTDLRGAVKAAALSQLFGAGNFVYAGDAAIDVEEKKKSGKAILVSPSKMALYLMKNRPYELFM